MYVQFILLFIEANKSSDYWEEELLNTSNYKGKNKSITWTENSVKNILNFLLGQKD